MFMKKALTVITSVLFLMTLTACNNMFSGDDIVIDDEKSQLWVANYNGGVGEDWLDKLVERFEEAYATYEFEPGTGKKGVQVVVDHGQSYRETANFYALRFDPNQVFFTEAVNVNELARAGLLLDITNTIKENLDGENKTIKDKLHDQHETGLSAFDGKYYAVPHYSLFNGINYNIDLFDDYGFYILDGYSGNVDFIGSNDKKSAGPDGIYGTIDDGLPSTYVEFLALLDYMVEVGVVPFIWSGQHRTYSNFLFNTLVWNQLGEQGTKTFLSYDSNGNTQPIVTGFNGDTPIIEDMVITPETGYLLSQHVARFDALQFAEQIYLRRARYVSDISFFDTSSYSEVQSEFIYSSLPASGQAPVAMMIEGTYWMNEASTIFKNSGVSANERRFGFMSVPTGPSNKENEFVAVDTYSSYAFINKNIEGNTNLENLAKTFLKFAYSDKSLQEFTAITNIPKAVKYTLSEEQKQNLNSYGQSVWDIAHRGSVIFNMWDSPLFIRYQNELGLDNFWSAKKVNGNNEYYIPLQAFKNNVTAKDYFLGMQKNEDEWQLNYGDSLE